jgi:hypothetical protein
MHWIDPDYLPEITGTVDQFLVNKHGEADGFLLTDGGEVHVPPHLSSQLLHDVHPGSKVRVRGVRPRGAKKPKHGPDHKGPKHHGKKYGPKHPREEHHR